MELENIFAEPKAEFVALVDKDDVPTVDLQNSFDDRLRASCCCVPLFAGLFVVIFFLVASAGFLPMILFRNSPSLISSAAFESFAASQTLAFRTPYDGKWSAEVFQLVRVLLMTMTQWGNQESQTRCCRDPLSVHDAQFGWEDPECGFYGGNNSSGNSTAWWYQIPLCSRWDQLVQDRSFIGSFGSKHGERRLMYFNIPQPSRQSQHQSVLNASDPQPNATESTNFNDNSGWSWSGMDVYSPRGDIRYMSDNSFSPVALRTWTASRRMYGPGTTPRQPWTSPTELDDAEEEFLGDFDRFDDEDETDLDAQLAGDLSFFDSEHDTTNPYLNLQSDVYKLAADGRVSSTYGGFTLNPTRWVLANYTNVMDYVGDALCNETNDNSNNSSSAFLYREWQQKQVPFGSINRCRVTAAMTSQFGALSTANAVLHANENSTNGTASFMSLNQLHAPGFLFGALRSMSRMDEAAMHLGEAELGAFDPRQSIDNCSCHASRRLNMMDATVPSLTASSFSQKKVRRSALVEFATPPSVLLHSFLHYDTDIALFGPELDPYGRLSFIFGVRITNFTTGTIDSVLLLMYPLKNVINFSMSMVTTWANRMDTYIFIFDWNDALIMTTHPLIPVEVPYPGDGEPNLYYCVNNSFRETEFRSSSYDPSLHNNHRWEPRKKIVRCRHSKASLSAVLPHFQLMLDESFRRAPSSPYYPAVTFEMEAAAGAAMFVAYNEVTFRNTSEGVDKCWGLLFAPTRSLLGAFDDSRRFVVILVAVISVAAALFAALLIYFLLVIPLETSLEDMRSALVLRPRGVSKSEFEIRREQRGTGYRSLLLPREIRCLDAANEELQHFLEAIATCLPPAVISRLYQDGETDESSELAASCEEHTEEAATFQPFKADSDIVDEDKPKFNSFEPAGDHPRSPDNGMMLSPNSATAVDQIVVKAGEATDVQDASGLPRRNSMNLSVSFAEVNARPSLNDRPLRRNRARGNPLDIQKNDDTLFMNDDNTIAVASDSKKHMDLSSSNGQQVPSILLPSGLSSRAPRPKCVFVSISLSQTTINVEEYRQLVESLAKLAWQHGGDVDLLERNRVAISFGCFRSVSQPQDAAILYALDVQQRFNSGALFSSEQMVPGKYGFLGIVIDAGRFEAFDFVTTIVDTMSDDASPAPTMLRRRIVFSTAATAAKRLHSLCDEIFEPLILTYDAVRGSAQPAILVDNIRFHDGVDAARLSRRGALPLLTVVSAKLLPEVMGTDVADAEAMLREFSWIAKDALSLMLRGMYLGAALQWSSLTFAAPNWLSAQRLNALCHSQAETSRGSYTREEKTMNVYSPDLN